MDHAGALKEDFSGDGTVVLYLNNNRDTEARLTTQEMTMHAQTTDRHRHSIPVIVALLAAVVGQAAILLNDFGAGSGSQGDGNPSMITAASVSRAGAIQIPSAPPLRPAAAAKSAT